MYQAFQKAETYRLVESGSPLVECGAIQTVIEIGIRRMGRLKGLESMRHRNLIFICLIKDGPGQKTIVKG